MAAALLSDNNCLELCDLYEVGRRSVLAVPALSHHRVHTSRRCEAYTHTIHSLVWR